MSTKLNILESKKLLKEFNYLMSDAEFKMAFAMEYSFEFEKEIIKTLRNEPIIKQACIDKFGELLKDKPKNDTLNYALNDAPKTNSTKVVVFSGESIKKSVLILEGDTQKVKHLYRKIVQKTHPDKVNSDALRELYNKATKANKSKDIITLYSICNELGIKFDITNSEISALRAQNKKIKLQQSNFEKSHLWMWVHSDDDNQKKEIIKHFLLHNAPSVKGLF